MEAVINTLISCDEQLKQKTLDTSSKAFTELLGQTTEVLSRAHKGHLDLVYASLTQHPPAQFFLLWSSLLEAESNLQDLDFGAFVRRVQGYATVCDKEHIKIVAHKFVTIMRNFTNRVIAAKKPMAAIRVLKVALNKLSPSNDHLTPLHSMFVQVCLLSKNYKAALSVLDRDVTEIDPTKTAVQPIDGVLYFYYGGMVYIGLKQFKKAQEFFCIAISSPAEALSAVVIECHKKFVLVSLLLDGTSGSLPRYTSGLVQRHLKIQNASYLNFAKVYQTYKQEALQESYTKFLPEFTKDNNAGLAAQVVESLYRRNILRLTQTYVTLSLANIATSVKLSSPQQAEEHLLRMIEDGVIHAKINQKEGMVSFQSNPEQYNSNRTMNKLDGHLKVAAALGDRIDDAQRKIVLSAMYIKRTLQGEKAPAPYDEAELEGPSDRHLGHVGVQLQ